QEKIRVVLLACGSFNPITNMHLRMFELARDHLEETGRYSVVKGIISPVGDAYKKKGLIEACHRVKMARLATESCRWISVDDWESQQAEWVETAKVMRNQLLNWGSARWQPFSRHINPSQHRDAPAETAIRWKVFWPLSYTPPRESVQLKLLCGADVLESFSIPNLWKTEDIKEIVGCFGLVCITRNGSDAEKFVYESDVLHEHRKNIHIVREWVTNEISATHVRRAVRRGQSVRYLLPEPVVQYIKDQHLYSIESEQKNTDIILAPLQRYSSAT
ncbi:nicotinamide nucleotide adenylyltransferase 1, partial [Silurus meridionalis]